MAGGLRERLARGVSTLRGRTGILIILLIVFVVIDGVFGWYIVTYSVADKSVEEVGVTQDILQLENSYAGVVVVRYADSVELILASPVELQFSGTPMDMALGDDSNALVVLTNDERLHFFPPGQTSEQWYLDVEGAFSLVGVVEEYSSMGHVPIGIAVLTSDQSGDSVQMISIDTLEVQWTYDFMEAVTGHARSDNTAYFSIVSGETRVIHFAQFSSEPRAIYDLEQPVDEVTISQSGTGVVILFDGGSKLSSFSTTSADPIWTAELPQGSKNLQLRSRSTYSYVQAGENVLVVEGGEVSTRIEVGGMSTYVVPKVVDKIFISVDGKVEGYKGTRAAPNWEASIPKVIENLRTDVGGTQIIGWQGTTILFINDSETPVGNDGMWTALGFLVIGQVAVLLIYGLWDRIVSTRKEALYLLIVGAIAGILIAYVLPDNEAIDWFGQGGYTVLAGILAAVSALIAWRTEAGLASVVVGVVVGIILAIPMALVAHFVMESAGYSFPDSAFYSLAKLVYTGLKMGLVGGVVGYAAQKLIR